MSTSVPPGRRPREREARPRCSSPQAEPGAPSTAWDPATYLVVIETAAEANFLMRLLQPNTCIGLDDLTVPGTCQWVKDAPLTYTAWQLPYPLSNSTRPARPIARPTRHRRRGAVPGRSRPGPPGRRCSSWEDERPRRHLPRRFASRSPRCPPAGCWQHAEASEGPRPRRSRLSRILDAPRPGAPRSLREGADASARHAACEGRGSSTKGQS